MQGMVAKKESSNVAIPLSSFQYKTLECTDTATTVVQSDPPPAALAPSCRSDEQHQLQ